MVKYCKKCGAKLEDNAKFCKNCGNTVSSESLAYHDKFGNKNTFSTSKSKVNKNTLIIAITIIVIAIIVAGALIYINSSNSDDSVTYVSNNGNSNNNANSNNDVDVSNDASSSNSVTIKGASFNLPSSAYQKDKYFYGFNFNGKECEIGLTEHYEANTATKTFSSTTLSQNYQGAENYILETPSKTWIGIKIGKGGKCYCIAMKTTSVSEAEELFAWMNTHNTWTSP